MSFRDTLPALEPMCSGKSFCREEAVTVGEPGLWKTSGGDRSRPPSRVLLGRERDMSAVKSEREVLCPPSQAGVMGKAVALTCIFFLF